MKLSMLIVIMLAIIAIFCIMQHKKIKEGLSGYGTISGLAMNNDAKVCFKNIYDPPDFPGYCSVIGKVVV